MKWKDEGERGEEKKNIGGIKGAGKNHKRDSCSPESPPPMKNSISNGKTSKENNVHEGARGRGGGLLYTRTPLGRKGKPPFLERSRKSEYKVDNARFSEGGICPCKTGSPI